MNTNGRSGYQLQNDFTDYRIDIVNNEFIACYGRKAAKDSWKTNVTAGGKVIPREANDEIVNIALRAAKACQLEIAGVDILFDIERQQYVVLEVNGIPAFATPQQEKSGLNFNTKKIDAIVQLIDEKVHEHRQGLLLRFCTTHCSDCQIHCLVQIGVLI